MHSNLELVLCYCGLRHHLLSWHSIFECHFWLFCFQFTFLLMPRERQWKKPQVPESLHPHGEPGWSSFLWLHSGPDMTVAFVWGMNQWIGDLFLYLSLLLSPCSSFSPLEGQKEGRTEGRKEGRKDRRKGREEKGK